MSYTLDALKRSELQRNATKIPTVAAPLGVLVESAHPGRMQWIVAAVVLAAAIAAGLLWWFGATSPRQLAQNVSAPVSGPVSSPVTDARINTEVSPGTAVQPAERNDLLPRLKLAVSIPPRREDASVAHAGGAKDKSASAKPGSRTRKRGRTFASLTKGCSDCNGRLWRFARIRAPEHAIACHQRLCLR